SLVYRGEERFLVQRLREISDRASPQRARAQRVIAVVRGDEDNWNRSPFAARCSCSSSPSMPGMRTSRIRQFVALRSAERKNSSADANSAGANPTTFINPETDSRTDWSSSITAMRAGFVIAGMIAERRDESLLHLRIRIPWYRVTEASKVKRRKVECCNRSGG